MTRSSASSCWRDPVLRDRGARRCSVGAHQRTVAVLAPPAAAGGDPTDAGRPARGSGLGVGVSAGSSVGVGVGVGVAPEALGSGRRVGVAAVTQPVAVSVYWPRLP